MCRNTIGGNNLLKAFFAAKEWTLWAYGGLSLLIISLWVQVQFTVAFNSWYGRFYNLLQASGSYSDNPTEGIDLFYGHLISLSYINNNFTGDASFVVLAFPYIVIAVLQAGLLVYMHSAGDKLLLLIIFQDGSM